MGRIHPLVPETAEPAEVIGGKASGLIVLKRLGLPVPEGFVIDTHAGRAFLRDGSLPADLGTAFRRLGAARVSVRSGAATSMPGMMTTRLDVGPGELSDAVREVFSSWRTPRAVTYRELHGIPHDLGTAVVVQAMVYGDRDPDSGTGVAFSRDPTTGARSPYGDVLFGHLGEDVVSGCFPTLPLPSLANRAPAVWERLTAALDRIERHYLNACHVEFTFESGRLWLLQVRPGGLAGRAAIRVAVDLADEELIDRREAVRRVSPAHLRAAAVPRMSGGDILTRGRGASPGVATGRVAVTADSAVRLAAEGPVVLVRPVTSPMDMHGLAVAAGIVTSRGGLAGHAAVVARSLGRPAVVDAAGLVVGAEARVGDRVLPEGTLLTLDGTSGEIALGNPGTTTAGADRHLRRLLEWADDLSGDHTPRPAGSRLDAARAIEDSARP